jgi:peroxiredoxin
MRITILITLLLSAFSFADLPKKGDTIPFFSVPALDNGFSTRLNKEKLKEAAKKSGTKRIALFFFDSKCPNCAEEFTLLKKNKSELEKKGMRIYLISVNEEIREKGAKVEKFVKDYAGGAFPFYFDSGVGMYKSLGLGDKTNYPLPTIVILGTDLKVIGVLVGKSENFPQVLWGEF